MSGQRLPIDALNYRLHFPAGEGREVICDANGRKRIVDVAYAGDGMTLHNKVFGFLRDPRFRAAYRAGAIESGHHIGRAPGSSDDIHIEFRVQTCCWAAAHAAKLDGDFVECGVNTGIFSLAICHWLDFNAMARRFFLFDTFEGIPEDQMSEAERPRKTKENSVAYSDCWAIAQRNFAPFPNAKLVRGKVPDTLATVEIERVAYLCLDMNIAYPERAAIEHFWPRLVPGAVVILDDYGFKGYDEQRATMDEFARIAGVQILALPTGQGMILRP
jgi:hypothetical protein